MSVLFHSTDDLDFVDSVSAGFSVQKDAEKASKCRERGNSSFKDGDYTAAALHYTQVRTFEATAVKHELMFAS